MKKGKLFRHPASYKWILISGWAFCCCSYAFSCCIVYFSLYIRVVLFLCCITNKNIILYTERFLNPLLKAHQSSWVPSWGNHIVTSEVPMRLPRRSYRGVSQLSPKLLHSHTGVKLWKWAMGILLCNLFWYSIFLFSCYFRNINLDFRQVQLWYIYLTLQL